MKIGVMSDTHGWWDDAYLVYLDSCDQIWHAGDIGSIDVLERLESFKPTRVVYGNIDDAQMRRYIPEYQNFVCEGKSVLITHIGGYPGNYSKTARELLISMRPDIFVCGHSHILKVVYDKYYDCLIINPGACGHHGIHKVRTLLRFDINDKSLSGMEVVELGVRGRL